MTTEDERPPQQPFWGDETEGARTQRQLVELLNEVRVAMPGVQVLFAFLLALPFQSRFSEITGNERTMYYTALLSSALASAFFVASAAIHRVLFHLHQREYIIRTGNRLTLAGLLALAVAMTAAISLATEFIYNDTAAKIAGLCTGLFLLGVWFVLPIERRLHAPAPPGSKE